MIWPLLCRKAQWNFGMKECISIALIGDYKPTVLAHQAIPVALRFAGQRLGVAIEPDWLHTNMLGGDCKGLLADFAGIWCVPNSPYANTDGAIAAIRLARETGVPFLGTCGGFQHALLEYARNVLGHRAADHAEISPDAEMPLIARLTCSLVEKTGTIRFAQGSRVRDIYGTDKAEEGYQCNFSLNPAYEKLFYGSSMKIAGRDAAGDVRAVELTGHPFFIATLYQPELAGLKNREHPLVTAFAAAAAGVG
jgi:CTP synthase (UTP-ammonia lyase)